MDIDFTFKHMDSTEAIKAHFSKRAERIQKLLPYDVKLHAIFSVEKTEQIAEIVCHVEHKPMTASASCKNMYEAIDECVHRLETQIKKDRDRRKGQHTAHAINRAGGKLASDVDAEIPHQKKVAGDS